MENSVESYINAQPEQIMDWNSYYNMRGREDHGNSWIDADPDFWFTKLADIFSGNIPTYKNQYKAYLENVNLRNEFLASQSARAWDKMMDDTKYQRMMKDFEAAGLNPYLLVNNGSFSTSAPTTSKADYKSSQKSDQKRDSGRNIALLLLALAKVASVLL